MSLKLMYITNSETVASIAESAGVDRIFVDLEYIGKSDRQGGMDTVQSKHTIEDIRRIRQTVNTELLVRCNPIHDATSEYESTEDEIDNVCSAGADVIMLPYFKTIEEIERFVKCVGTRAKKMLLIETPEAVEIIDDILRVDGIDEFFVGLNDLSLGYGKKFMFELLADGTIEMLCEKFKEKGLPYGFGGIASLEKGLLPAEHIIAEHYRLGSTRVILSRSFCDTQTISEVETVTSLFRNGISDIRQFEDLCKREDDQFFVENKHILKEKVDLILGN